MSAFIITFGGWAENRGACGVDAWWNLHLPFSNGCGCGGFRFLLG
jgi:hypothetical protein